MNFKSHVSGIPCIIELDGESYEVLDRRGNPAPWLTKKVTRQDDIRIYEEIEDFLYEDARA